MLLFRAGGQTRCSSRLHAAHPYPVCAELRIEVCILNDRHQSVCFGYSYRLSRQPAAAAFPEAARGKRISLSSGQHLIEDCMLVPFFASWSSSKMLSGSDNAQSPKSSGKEKGEMPFPFIDPRAQDQGLRPVRPCMKRS